MRTADALHELVSKTFFGSDIEITPAVLSLDAAPDVLAREAAGFFYASFVLSVDGHRQMLVDLERHFSTNLKDGASSFGLPINRLVVR